MDDRCLHHSLHTQPNPDVAELDLRNLTFVDPAGLVLIASTASRCVDEGTRVVVRSPEDESRARYLDRMGLTEVLQDMGITTDLRRVRRMPLGDRVLELSRFEGGDIADDLAEQVHRLFSDVEPATARALYASVQELAQNVIDHSGARHGFVALQQYNGQDGPEVAFAIGDAGIGLRASLSSRYDVNDDMDAIDLAIRRGVTSVVDHEGRGIGLHSVVSVTQRHPGNVRLWSYTASAQFRGGRKVASRSRKIPYPGTMVVARIGLR